MTILTNLIIYVLIQLLCFDEFYMIHTIRHIIGYIIRYFMN